MKLILWGAVHCLVSCAAVWLIWKAGYTQRADDDKTLTW